MAQADFGNPVSPFSGPALIADIEAWRDALHSTHKGNSRPPYAAVGMIWVNDTTTPWIINMFDGTDDIVIGTVNATTNLFTPAGVLKNNTAATTAPTTANDSTQGYAVGSIWINTTSHLTYICVNPASGAAIWEQLFDTSSTLAIVNGGTGATTAAGARTNLAVPNIAGDTLTGIMLGVAPATNANTAGLVTAAWANDNQLNQRPTIGTLTSGASTTAYTATISPAPAALVAGKTRVLVPIGTVTNTTTTPTFKLGSLGSAVNIISNAAAGTALPIGALPANADLLWNGTNWVCLNPVAASSPLTPGTTTSFGSAPAISASYSIPAGCKRFTVCFDQVRINGAVSPTLQMGPSAGLETSGYSGTYWISGGALNPFTNAINFGGTSASNFYTGIVTFILMDASSNTWAFEGAVSLPGVSTQIHVSGIKSLAGPLANIALQGDGSTLFNNGLFNIITE